MTAIPTLETVLRHEHAVVGVSHAVITAIAWLWADAGATFAMWMVMMARD